jgi:alkylation response protein AidB-like acyl-CoA dehydrogenase
VARTANRITDPTGRAVIRNLSPEQELLRDTARRFLTTAVSRPQLRAVIEAEAPFPLEWWRQSAEIGWFSSLLFDDADARPAATLALLAYEAGHELAPVPLVGTNVVIDALLHCAPDRWRDVVDELSAGQSLAAWCADDRALLFGAAPQLDVRGEVGDRRVSGSVITNARADVDWLLVTAMTETQPVQHLLRASTPGIEIRPVRAIDFSREYVEVAFDDVVLVADSVVPHVPGQVQRQLDLALLIEVAETAGAMDAGFAITLEWLANRRSFGRPLSSYQALKHRVADMRVWLEAAFACRDGLAAAMDGESADDRTLLASCAKAYVSHHAAELLQDCVQMHGGMGVTWEHDLHLYLRRATAHWGTFGTPADHYERITTLLEKE